MKHKWHSNPKILTQEIQNVGEPVPQKHSLIYLQQKIEHYYYKIMNKFII